MKKILLFLLLLVVLVGCSSRTATGTFVELGDYNATTYSNYSLASFEGTNGDIFKLPVFEDKKDIFVTGTEYKVTYSSSEYSTPPFKIIDIELTEEGGYAE